MLRIMFLFVLVIAFCRIFCNSGRKIFESPTDRVIGNSTSKVLQIILNINRTQVQLNGRQIYSHKGNITTDKGTGIHMIVLHQYTFRTLFSGIFYTAQPSGDKHLIRRLFSVQQGRIVILVGSTFYSSWVRGFLKSFLKTIGSIYNSAVAHGESWCFVFKNGISRSKKYDLDVEYWQKAPDILEIQKLNEFYRVITDESREVSKFTAEEEKSILSYNNSEIFNGVQLKNYQPLFESIATVRTYGAPSHYKPSSPQRFEIVLRSERVRECDWFKEANLKTLANFCINYDGFKPFCRCEDRKDLLHINLKIQAPFYYRIPVALVTAGTSRLNQVLRQVRRIRAADGGSEIPLLLCVDGYNEEANLFSKLLQIKAMFHHNKYEKGSRDRVNDHVRWCLQKVFEVNPNATYAIILEDDLDVSPDFVSYFQQIAWVMDADESILFASAYNYNAFPHTALDSTAVRVVQSYPYYGWMVRRKHAKKLLNYWTVPKQESDWDLFIHYHHMNKSYVIIPEVPRTKHIGGGGVHVTGFEQELYYDIRPLNTKASVTLDLMRSWPKSYILDLMKFIMQAKKLVITRSPCDHNPLSMEKPGGNYVLFMNLTGDGDDAKAYATIARCFGFYRRSMNEQLDGVMLKRYFHNYILLVACPVSPYCILKEKDKSIYTPTKEHIQHSLTMPFIRVLTGNELVIRRKAKNYEEEVSLRNRDTVHTKIMN